MLRLRFDLFRDRGDVSARAGAPSVGRQANFIFRGSPKARDDRGLQRGHVITLDPELVDVVRNKKREGFVRHAHKLYGGKPALVSIRADLRFERGRKLRPNLGTFLFHTDLLTALNDFPFEPLSRGQCLRSRGAFARRRIDGS